MKRIKAVFLIFIGVIISSVTVYAASYLSENIQYSNPKNSKIKTVKDALDYLYDNNSTVNHPWNFAYSGTPQTFTVPTTGVYKLEVWGAQGGSNISANAPGGKGGYSMGYKKLEKASKLYVYVGGAGESNFYKNETYGGWNGGGGIYVTSFESTYDPLNGTGGGATDISTVYSDVVKNSSTLRYERTKESYDGRIIVAGAGGGGGDLYHIKSVPGGYGGGETGGSFGGTQSGITNPLGTGILAAASLGLGGSAKGTKDVACIVGGGAGYYGGSHSQAWGTVERTKPSGGGSGYIGGVTDYNDDKAKMISGLEEMPTYYGNGKMTGNSGNGFAKITLISID